MLRIGAVFPRSREFPGEVGRSGEQRKIPPAKSSPQGLPPIGVGRPADRILPGGGPRVTQLFGRFVPRSQSQEGIQRQVQVPGLHVRPQVLQLLVPGSGELLESLEGLFHSPGVGCQPQNIPQRHLRIATEEKVAAVFLSDDHQPDRSSGRGTAGHKALDRLKERVAVLARHDRHPPLRIGRTLGQAYSLGTVLPRAAAAGRPFFRGRRQGGQSRIFPQPTCHPKI